MGQACHVLGGSERDPEGVRICAAAVNADDRQSGRNCALSEYGVQLSGRRGAGGATSLSTGIGDASKMRNRG